MPSRRAYGNLQAPCCAATRALAHAPHDRSAFYAAHAADLALRGVVELIGEQGQHLAQRSGVLAATAFDEAKIVEAEHIDQPPADNPTVGDFAAAAQLGDHRLAWWRGTSDAHQIKGGIVKQPKVGAALADR